jgi:peptidoglycan hydrolase-like protein with peptidoglycan-binding domain
MRKPTQWCLALSVCLLLAACGRRQDEAPVMDAQPANSATADAGDAATTAAAPLVISVVSEDGEALDADIYLARAADAFDAFTHVARPGPKALGTPCEPGQRFQARPVIEDFRQGKLVDCAPRLDFVMYSVQRTFNISREGQQALDRGDLLLAQERLGLAADRYEFTAPAQARRLRLMSTAAAGRLLGVADPIDSQGAQPVPSEELRQRVRAFQAEHALQATGELDARTRAALSRMQLRGADVVVPPATQVPRSGAPLADPRATVPASEAALPAAAAAGAASIQEPAPDLRTSVQQVMAAPASADDAAIIRGNRLKAQQMQGAVSR